MDQSNQSNSQPPPPPAAVPDPPSVMENTVITPRTRSKRLRQKLAYGLVGLCGALAAVMLFHACGSSPKNDQSADTSITQKVFAGTANAAPRKLKLVDASKCRRDQIRIVGDSLVTDSDCTTIVYDDK